MPLTNIIIPTTPLPPTEVEPSLLVLYARPKLGKTTILSQHPGLLIDTQGGSRAVSARRIDMLDEYTKAVAGGWKHSMYSFFLAFLKDVAGKEHTLIIDTFGDIEDWIVDQLDAMLGDVEKPVKADVLDYGRIACSTSTVANMPHGAGYEKIRTAVRGCLAQIRKAAPRTILVCHTRDKYDEKTSRVAEALDLDLRGKVRNIVAGLADGVGFMVRKDPKVIVTFRVSELASGNRFTYLDGKEFTLSEKMPDGTIKTYWHHIYPSLAGK